MRIGVDVGGTNTDAVLVDGTQVLASVKEPTSADIVSGLAQALARLVPNRAELAAVDAIVIGTTQLTNALIERRGLNAVGILRIGLPATQGLPPQVGWPADLVQAVGAEAVMVRGGHESDGREITPLDEDTIRSAARRFRKSGLRSVAVTSVFAPLVGLHEARAAEILREELPEAAVSLSADLGGVGLLERENATIVNAALAEAAARVVSGFRAAVAGTGYAGPVFLTQNDGTILDLDQALRFPVLTFASGPTNSMRGAHLLTGLAEAMVADIGGTTTDIGTLTGGYPRQATSAVDLGGLRTAFRMPDLLVVGLGGGSVVEQQADGSVTVGPRSVAHALSSQARAFGGAVLTATDIAVAQGLKGLGRRSALGTLPPALVDRAQARMMAMLEDGIDRLRTGAKPLPLALVGGGAVLIRGQPAGIERLVRPRHAEVANAVGAATAEVGAGVDRILPIPAAERARILQDLQAEARAAAVAAGARPDAVRIHSIEEVQVAYAPPETRRVRIRALGPLDPAHLTRANTASRTAACVF
ncbi:MAG: hydantoinase/oxoprolinase family protein [Pararhodobacter sp.]|nr:hydantoinase/oxoprolinase family protein [Pararhodobacter sp.]